MEHLNFCRKMTIEFSAMTEIPSIDPELRERMQHCITLAAVSHKFMLPDDGFLIDDDELRALDESKPLRLPFPSVALEYRTLDDGSTEGERSSKRIVFATEMENGINFRCVAWMDRVGGFQPYAAFHLRNGLYLRRDIIVDNLPSIQIMDLSRPNNRAPMQFDRDDSSYEARVLLGFLNALSCINVRTERSEPRKSGKKIKSALPFDTYHILTIDVGRATGAGTGLTGISHRSPREHLRRGHIRRLEDGRRIWVNATVVAAGRGAAKVEKDYRVTNSKAGAISAKVSV